MVFLKKDPWWKRRGPLPGNQNDSKTRQLLCIIQVVRILEINTERGWRGGERQTLYTLEALLGKGVEVDLLCLKGTPLYERALKGRLEHNCGVRGGDKGGPCHPTQVLDHDSIKSVPSQHNGNQVENDCAGGRCGSVRDQRCNGRWRNTQTTKGDGRKKIVGGRKGRLGSWDTEDSGARGVVNSERGARGCFFAGTRPNSANSAANPMPHKCGDQAVTDESRGGVCDGNHRHTSLLGAKIYGARSNLDAFLFLLINGRRYDLIHCQTSRAQTLAVFSKPFHRRPVVYTRRVDFKPSGFFTKIKYKLTDKVVAISGRIKLIIAEAGLKPLQEIEVIPSAVKETPLNKERALKLKEDLKIGNRKVIATVGALVSHKDPLTMVEAVRMLSKMRDDFVFLHFGDGWLREAIDKRIREYGLKDKYILVGFQEDVEDFFSIIDVFVMSSKEEGLGSAVLDAFVYRVPVVSTDAGGLKETVEGRGIVCPIGDAACIAQGIDALLDNNDLRRCLVEKAYTDVKAKYSVEKMAEAYLRVFSSLESRKGKK